MPHSHLVLDNYGHTHTHTRARALSIVILIAFPQQQLLQESAAMLRLYVNCLSCPAGLRGMYPTSAFGCAWQHVCIHFAICRHVMVLGPTHALC